LHTIRLSDLHVDCSKDVEPNFAKTEYEVRPKEKPTAVIDIPPEDGELNMPGEWTTMTGVLKLKKFEMAEYLWPTVAMPLNRNPLPAATLHKTVELAIQVDISQLVP
jgi:hypothetical protein